jgi:hypothetical protein
MSNSLSTADRKEALIAASKLAAPVWESLVDFCSDHLRHYGCYPASFSYDDKKTGKVIFDTYEVLNELSEEDKLFIENDAKEYSIKSAKKQWEKLGSVLVDDNEKTMERFKHFPAGTDFHEIWHWFEKAFYKVSVAELMGVAQAPNEKGE